IFSHAQSLKALIGDTPRFILTNKVDREELTSKQHLSSFHFNTAQKFIHIKFSKNYLDFSTKSLDNHS
ncbi:hypothetical protein, partial [Bacillus sp. JJ1764]|uniref:hypothetical protein n=1 Tax=Bacillus sp. JJ1764 TaxID=3122964 RepID=UPI00300019EB